MNENRRKHRVGTASVFRILTVAILLVASVVIAVLITGWKAERQLARQSDVPDRTGRGVSGETEQPKAESAGGTFTDSDEPQAETALQNATPDGTEAVGTSTDDESTQESSSSQTAGSESRNQASEPPPPHELPPWQIAMDAIGDPPDALQVCFDDFNLTKFVPQRDDLMKWFSLVPGQRSNVKNVKIRIGEVAAVEGVVRLQMPWHPDIALRLSLQDCRDLSVHLFTGSTGVTLAYHERDRNRWGAYLTTRAPGAPVPQSYALATTDESRGRRTEFRRGGTIELRCRDGHVVLSRGDVILLRAPLPTVPEEVYLEGYAVVHGISAVASGSFPSGDQPDNVVSDTEDTAELPWEEQLAEGMQLERTDAGSVSLSGNQPKEDSWVATPLASTGPREVILELSEMTLGTGVFLARQDGKPHEIVRVVRDRRSGANCLSLRTDGASEVALPPVGEAIVPLVGERVWIRLVFGCGILRYWLSCDGEDWASAEATRSGLYGPVSHVGLHCMRGAEEARITLRRLTLRSFPELESLGDTALIAQAPTLHDAANIGDWLVRVTESQPPEVDLELWRRSCAIRTLGEGCRKDLGTSIVELLMDDSVRRRLPLQRQLALLEEAAVLCDTYADYHLLHNILGRHYDLGLTGLEHDGLRPWTSICHELMSFPLATAHDVHAAEERTIRAELIQLTCEGRWAEAREFCRRLRYFRQQDVCRLVPWAEAAAQRQEMAQRPGEQVVAYKNEWHQPLIEEVDKDNYNFMADLHALLESEAFADAASLVTSIDADNTWGVSPHVRDRQLLVSLPSAIAMALDEYPDLRQAINRDHGQAAKLRVRQAIGRNDLSAVRMATIQFTGLEAGAEAHRWLGDRALSAGWFEGALVHYRQAGKSSAIAEQSQLAARARLAAAMLGRHETQTDGGDFRASSVHLDSTEFDALIEDLVQRKLPDTAGTASGHDAQRVLPGPCGFQVQQRGRLDGQVGSKPEAELIPSARRYKVNWAGRQLATAIDGDVMFVSNRFHLAAYEVKTGRRRWQSQLADREPMRSQDWGLIRMKPVVTTDRLFVRLLYGPGPVMVCLDKSNGEVLWTAELPATDFFVSDPMIVRGKLAALTLTRGEQSGGVLRLSMIDQKDGRVVRQHALAHLNDTWWQRRCCETTTQGDGYVAVLSGLALAGDLFGNVRWIRQTSVLPSSEEPTWVRQYFHPPLVHGNELYLAQPGVRAVERVDIRSGRLVWSRTMPDVQRVIGVSSDRLILQVERGLAAVARASGEPIWLHPTQHLPADAWCDASTVLYAGYDVAEEQAKHLAAEFVWLDASNGRRIARTRLDGKPYELPGLAPVIPVHDRLWAFSGHDSKNPQLDLLELVPDGEPDLAEPADVDVDAWAKHVPLSLRMAAADLFGDWQLLSGALVQKRSIEPVQWGESDVLATHAERGAPVTLARQTAIPAGGRPRLRLKIANTPKDPCVLEVRLNGQVVFHEMFTDKTHGQPWKSLEIDLADVAGKQGWVILEASTPEGRAAVDVFWKQVEIVF